MLDADDVRLRVGDDDDAGLDVNVRALQNRWTPLHVAAARGHLDLVRMLISEWSAEVDAKDGVNHTPLIIASCNGFMEVSSIVFIIT